MTHDDARKLLLQSGCVKSGQGYVIVVPIELFIERMKEALYDHSGSLADRL